MVGRDRKTGCLCLLAAGVYDNALETRKLKVYPGCSTLGVRMNLYDDTFFEYINLGAISSARAILEIVRDILEVESVVDFGCGQGAWLKTWQGLGVEDLVGVDGDYVERSKLLIDFDSFRSHDLTRPLDLGRRFDLVQSLEVAEHLPRESGPDFVSTLVAHGSHILFSAAVPGQGGANHINERPLDYWRALFRNHGYVALDPIRPRVSHDRTVEPWYRYNTLLYVTESSLSTNEILASHHLSENEPVPDRSPMSFRCRRALLRHLPPSTVTRLSHLKLRGTLLRRKLGLR